MPFGINWKIVGLVCGACAAPFTGGTSLVAACVACGGAGLVAGHFLDEKEKKDKIDKQNVDLKVKTLDEAKEDNKQAREEEKKLKDELEEQNKKNENLEKELNQARQKANSPSLSEEERAKWRRKIVVLEDQLNGGKENSKSLIDRLKQLGSRIKNNNKAISGAGLNTDEKSWVWDLFTMENIFIVSACFVAYKILKDDRK